jgi:hypothetical protein
MVARRAACCGDQPMSTHDQWVVAVFEYLSDGTVRQTYPVLTTDRKEMRVQPPEGSQEWQEMWTKPFDKPELL